MATPFSPFTGRINKPILKRRQSQIPQELIDWDAPEIPEVEKQKIVYEEQIRELTEDHEIERLLEEQLAQVAHETIVNNYQMRLKEAEDEKIKEQSKVNLLLGQIRMFEASNKENEERLDSLETENNSLKTLVDELKQEKESLLEDKVNLQVEIENLNFRNNETKCEMSQNLEYYIEKKNEVEDLKKKLDAAKAQLSYYKKRAKNKENHE